MSASGEAWARSRPPDDDVLDVILFDTLANGLEIVGREKRLHVADALIDLRGELVAVLLAHVIAPADDVRQPGLHREAAVPEILRL